MFGFFKRSQQKEEPVKQEPIEIPVEEKSSQPLPASIQIISLRDGSVIAVIQYDDTSRHPETYIRHAGSWHFFNGDPMFTTHGRVGYWVGLPNQKAFETAYQEILTQMKGK